MPCDQFIFESCKLTLFSSAMRMSSATKPCAHPRLRKTFFGNHIHLWKIFKGNNFPNEFRIMLKIRFSECFIATSECQVFSAKSFSHTHVLYKKVVLKENQRKKPMHSPFKNAGLLSANSF